MKYWVTTIKAINPRTSLLDNWIGPNVPGISKKDAERYCQQNGLGYCQIAGELIAEGYIDPKTGKIDKNKTTDYETISQN